jgi:ribosomal protein L24
MDKGRQFAEVVADGQLHRVYKKGDSIIVDHAGKNNGKWDKIDLTQKAGATTVAAGVKAVRAWHKAH